MMHSRKGPSQVTLAENGGAAALAHQEISLNAPPCSPERRSWTLYHPRDRDHLSDFSCFIRAQLELFVATPFDLRTRTKRTCLRDNISVGNVGLRCVHCSSSRGMHDDMIVRFGEKRERCAVFFPGKTHMVNEGVRNWQFRHFKGCKKVPKEVRAEFERLKKCGRQKRSAFGLKYWVESCRLMGLVDTEKGMRLQSGVFPSREDEANGIAGNDAGKRMVTEVADSTPERIFTKKRKILPQDLAQQASGSKSHRADPLGPHVEMSTTSEFVSNQNDSQLKTSKQQVMPVQCPVGLASRLTQMRTEIKQNGTLPLPPPERHLSNTPNLPLWPGAPINPEYEYRMKLLVFPVAVLQKKQKQLPPSEAPREPTQPRDMPTNAEGGDKLSLLVQAVDSVEERS